MMTEQREGQAKVKPDAQRLWRCRRLITALAVLLVSIKR